jgi:hypothetical protein
VRVGVAGGCESGGLALDLEGLGTATVAAPGLMSQAAYTRRRARGFCVAMVAVAVAIAARAGVSGSGGHWSLDNPAEILSLFIRGQSGATCQYWSLECVLSRRMAYLLDPSLRGR